MASNNLTMKDLGGLVKGGQLTPIGTIGELAGQYSQTKDATSALNTSAAWERTQADIYEKLNLKDQLRDASRGARRFEGRQASRIGKSGLSFGGSNAQIFVDNANEIQRNVAKIQYNSLVRTNAMRFSALKKETQARNLQAQMVADMSKTLMTDVIKPIGKAQIAKNDLAAKEG
jgi:hypothetical protein